MIKTIQNKWLLLIRTQKKKNKKLQNSVTAEIILTLKCQLWQVKSCKKDENMLYAWGDNV